MSISQLTDVSLD